LGGTFKDRNTGLYLTAQRVKDPASKGLLIVRLQHNN